MTDRRNNYGPFDSKYFVEESPLEDMFASEKKDLGERISKLESWITDRNALMYDNLARIDEKECEVDSQIYWARCIHPYEPREVQGLEKTLVDLEVQRRLERGGAWKDCFLVNKELIELIRQYQQLKRRDVLLK